MAIITPNCTLNFVREKNSATWKPSVTWKMSATPCSCVRFRTAIPWPRHNSWPVWYVFICWNTAAGEMMCSFRDHVSSHSFSLLMRRTLRGHEKKCSSLFPEVLLLTEWLARESPGFGETKGSLGLWSLLLLFRGEYKRRPWLITAKCASCLAKFRSSRKKPTHSSWFAFWSCHYHNAVCYKLNASTGGWEQGGVFALPRRLTRTDQSCFNFCICEKNKTL